MFRVSGYKPLFVGGLHPYPRPPICQLRRIQVQPLQLTLCRNFSSVSIDVCVRISIDCCCVRNGLIDGILCLDDDWPNSELFEPPHELRDDVSDCCADDNSCESD
jgi:hypothetical protein